MDYWGDRRSDPNGQHLILSIEPNGAPPGKALSTALPKNRWATLRQAVIADRELRCETCGIEVDPEQASYLHIHESWHHTDERTVLDPYFGLICADCHNVMHIIWVRQILSLGMDRFRDHFCVVNGVDEKEFHRHLKWALQATSPRVPPPADYGVWAALFDVKERKRLEILICSVLAGIPKRVIDGSNWSSIEDRRCAFAKQKAEEERMKIEKEQRKAERLRQQHAKLARLGLIPQELSPDNFDLEPLMQWALEEYGDWRV